MKRHPARSITLGRGTRSRAACLLAVVVPLTLPLTLVAALAPAALARTATVPADAPATATVPLTTQATTFENPLRGRRWGVYRGRADQAWAPYENATGTERTLLGKIALRPRATWFGAWTANADIRAKVDAYIANSSGGDPDVLVQMTVFRMKPWEHDACNRLPTTAEQDSYRGWVRRFAAAVGAQHTALILQPDGPFALCAPGGSKVPSHLIGYAARVFSALPHTSVYIDSGASDWPSDDPKKAADILIPASVSHARGFALNSTHYVSTASDIEFGTRIVQELASRGVPGKHFVINTAQNGAPFRWSQKRTSNFDNSPVCRSKIDTRCVTLGIPPTTSVASTRWGLGLTDRNRARAHVDGYLWYGRPWLYMQADPYLKSRALALARTTPY
jgi:endoglucanase